MTSSLLHHHRHLPILPFLMISIFVNLTQLSPYQGCSHTGDQGSARYGELHSAALCFPLFHTFVKCTVIESVKFGHRTVYFDMLLSGTVLYSLISYSAALRPSHMGDQCDYCVSPSHPRHTDIQCIITAEPVHDNKA